MLFASKAELHASTAQHILRVRERELKYYTTNILNIGMQAALLSGFAFTTLASHDSAEMLSWIKRIADDSAFANVFVYRLNPQEVGQTVLEVFYLASTISAMGSTLYSLYICLLTSILGPGLALRGPEGSVDSAVLSMARINRSVVRSFSSSLNLFQLSILLKAFLTFHVIAAAICGAFVVYYMWVIIHYANNLSLVFKINEHEIVSGRFEAEGDKAWLKFEQDDLFPSLTTQFRTFRQSWKGLCSGKTDASKMPADINLNPESHKPSNVASDMMYFWQGPLPLKRAGFDKTVVERGDTFDNWFSNIFGDEDEAEGPREVVSQEEQAERNRRSSVYMREAAAVGVPGAASAVVANNPAGTGGGGAKQRRARERSVRR